MFMKRQKRVLRSRVLYKCWCGRFTHEWASIVKENGANQPAKIVSTEYYIKLAIKQQCKKLRGAVVRTVASADLQRTHDEMELLLAMCTEMCPHSA
jgi:hypothetical protein